MSPPIIIASAWSSYDADVFAIKRLVRYEGRVLHGFRAVLLFRTGLDVSGPNQSGPNKPLCLVRWQGMEPYRGELLWASREQDATRTFIVMRRDVRCQGGRPSIHPTPQVNITILNLAPRPAAHRAIEGAAPEQPIVVPSSQPTEPLDAQVAPASVIGERQSSPAPPVQVKGEDQPVDVTTTETREVVDLTWIDDDEEDIKPTMSELERECGVSTPSRRMRPASGVRMKLATCPSKAEIRAMARYVANKPPGTDMEAPEQWMDFDPRRGIFAWTRIHVRRKDEIERLVLDIRRRNGHNTEMVIKQE
ncbi:unnamed protein product [Peniophora sp. CBMAI 1063]|nr:unnamed protein product [Peniophora sp. CBMAI 1063]